MSGRYTLNEQFKLQEHDDEANKDKFVVHVRVNAMNTVLYSLPPSLIHVLRKGLEETRDRCYIDVEHTLCRCIPMDIMFNQDVQGVQGNIASLNIPWRQ